MEIKLSREKGAILPTESTYNERFNVWVSLHWRIQTFR